MFTGKKTSAGANRSHACNKTKRTFKVNLLKVKLDLGDGVKIPVKISAKAYKKMR
jgi:large subunit ribosomal protein L28